jgi:hypothetical protein
MVGVTCRSGVATGALWLGLNLLGVKGIALSDEVRDETLCSFSSRSYVDWAIPLLLQIVSGPLDERELGPGCP